MYKITCGAYGCSHNMAGGCDAGVVSVQEQIGEKAPRCATYTQKDDSENATYDISPLGFRCYRRPGSIVCAMQSCGYLRDGLCCADSVLMDVSAPGGDIWCMTYREKQK